MVEKSVPFWDAQKNNNLTYFRDVGATVQTKVKGQLVSIKQERSLLSRLLVVCKTRNVFSVKHVITEFEFNVAPPSNFHPDGSMIMLSDKSKLVPAVMKSPLPLPDELSIPEPAEGSFLGPDNRRNVYSEHGAQNSRNVKCPALCKEVYWHRGRHE